MSELSITQQPLPNPDELYNRGKLDVSDVRQLNIGNGQFKIIDGRLEARDSSGNLVILLDPNG